MDEKEANVIWLESAKQNFDEALAENDWDTCRAVLADMEENGFAAKTYELRRTLNIHMAAEESCDYDGVKYESDRDSERESRSESYLSSQASEYGGY